VPQILAYPEAGVPDALRAQVLALQAEAFGGEVPGDDVPAGLRPALGPVHDPALFPVSMLLVTGGASQPRVLSALDVLAKRIVHAGQEWAVTGLSTVVTAASERGKGYGRTLVEAAREAMAVGGADLALFTCDADLVGFYTGCGFVVLDDAIVVGGTPQDPLRSDSLGKVTLARFCTDRARACAAAFEHCAIELYPGTVDRLW
jgi:GNAT superfamily N-acetyltransferase